jgi:hypothetical protein
MSQGVKAEFFLNIFFRKKIEKNVYIEDFFFKF